MVTADVHLSFMHCLAHNFLAARRRRRPSTGVYGLRVR
jgi:hypothetical protein